jgi:hypothetical protein
VRGLRVRVAVVGPGPEAAAVALGLARLCGDYDVALVLTSTGHGVSAIELPYTEKANLASQEGTLKMLSKALSRVKLERGFFIEAISDSRLLHTVRRVGLTVWSRHFKRFQDTVVAEEFPHDAPESLRGLVGDAGVEGFIASRVRIVERPRMLASILRSSNVFDSVELSSWVRIELDGEIRGVSTRTGYERVDAVVAFSPRILPPSARGFASSLPKKVRVTLTLQPPIPGGPAILSLGSLALATSRRGSWATASLEVQGGEEGADFILEISSLLAKSMPKASGLVLSGLHRGEDVASPDNSPLAGRVDGMPENLYLVQSCGLGCLSLSHGIAETICKELTGGRGVYSFTRFSSGEALREYLALP